MNQRIELLEKCKTKIITLKYAKQYLRIDHNYDDEIIVDMIDVAIESAENYLGRHIQKSKWRMTIYGSLPSFIKLLYGPVNCIEKFKLFRGDNEVYYLSSDKYFLDKDNETIHLKRYAFTKRIEIEYSNGFPEGQFPASIKQGILEHLARLYDSRGSDQTLPISSKSFYQPYKKVRINE